MASANGLFPLEVSDLAVTLGGRVVLDGIAFRIDAPRRVVVLGANGAGKSVLLRTLHGLVAPSRGEVRWGPGARQGRQGMVFQRPVMLRRSAQANVTYALAVNGVPRRDRPARATLALDRVGLRGCAHAPARTLSVGEQQRLALARAWALDPQVLLLDEPTASLDPASTAQIEAIIDEIHAAGTGILMSTHNLGQARRVADEILLVHGGRVTELTPADEFFRRPRSAEGAAFLEGELPWK